MPYPFDLKDPGDEAVLAGYIAGPGPMREAFMPRFGALLYTFAGDQEELVGRGLRDDIVSEACAMLLAGRREYRMGGNPVAFLRYVVRSAARTVRAQNRSLGPAPRNGPAPEARPADEKTPVEDVAGVEACEVFGQQPTSGEPGVDEDVADELRADTGDADGATIMPFPSERRPRRINRDGTLVGVGAPPPVAGNAEDAVIEADRVGRILREAMATSSSATAPALLMRAGGESWAEIGRRLGLDPATLKYHVRKLHPVAA